MWAFQRNLGLKWVLLRVPSISKPTRQETVAPSEEAQPTLEPWTGFEPVRLETPRTPKHACFHCTTASITQYFASSEREVK
ncbi:hypothetical protein E2C01_094455 [Portunus trituberculatus]|uniref:Uncharacterized protein n=1 Tax=Portunus trituberculatus TaxID=210409 RepID=A0A5B7JQH0_PORTR|nr:hypothetical protein [Portunus trituberculatus]